MIIIIIIIIVIVIPHHPHPHNHHLLHYYGSHQCGCQVVILVVMVAVVAVFQLRSQSTRGAYQDQDQTTQGRYGAVNKHWESSFRAVSCITFHVFYRIKNTSVSISLCCLMNEPEFLEDIHLPRHRKSNISSWWSPFISLRSASLVSSYHDDLDCN